MPLLVRETRSEESLHQVFGQFHANDARTEHQHVHIVMFDALMCRIAVMANRSTNAYEFICRDACTDAASANQNAAIRFSIKHRSAHRFCEVWIVRRILVERANIQYRVSESAQHIAHGVF